MQIMINQTLQQCYIFFQRTSAHFVAKRKQDIHKKFEVLSDLIACSLKSASG